MLLHVHVISYYPALQARRQGGGALGGSAPPNDSTCPPAYMISSELNIENKNVYFTDLVHEYCRKKKSRIQQHLAQRTTNLYNGKLLGSYNTVA